MHGGKRCALAGGARDVNKTPALAAFAPTSL